MFGGDGGGGAFAGSVGTAYYAQINVDYHKLFVTSTMSLGSLPPIGTLDAAGYPAGVTWKVVLSFGGNASARVTVLGNVLNPRGEAVVTNPSNFWSSPWLAAAAYQENGLAVSDLYAWNGSNADGSASGFDCNGWSDATSGFSGRVGGTVSTTTPIVSSTASCDDAKSFYCLSQ